MMLDYNDMDGDEIDLGSPIKSKEDWISDQNNWSKYLNEWEENMFIPVFSKRGYTKNTALMCWFMNMSKNEMTEIFEILNEKLNYGSS